MDEHALTRRALLQGIAALSAGLAAAPSAMAIVPDASSHTQPDRAAPLDLLSSEARFEAWEGLMPATCEDPDTGRLLGHSDWRQLHALAHMDEPVFFDHGGIFSYYRIRGCDGAVLAQGRAGCDENADLQMDTVNIVTGNSLQLNMDFEIE